MEFEWLNDSLNKRDEITPPRCPRLPTSTKVTRICGNLTTSHWLKSSHINRGMWASQTSRIAVGMSVSCQERTLRLPSYSLDWLPSKLLFGHFIPRGSEVSHGQGLLQTLVRWAPRSWGARHDDQSKPCRAYLAIEAWAAAIFAFTASRLKLAPLCIGGNSIAVIASFSTCC